MIRRDRTIMIKRETLKRVTLPDGRTFVARYKRVTRVHLPANLRLRKNTNKVLRHEVDVDKWPFNEAVVYTAVF